MDVFVKIVQLVLALSLLVAIHEAGHFFMARIFKIRVEKFFIFFDPWFSLLSWRKSRNGGKEIKLFDRKVWDNGTEIDDKQSTEYGMGWLPLGGYVKIAGMIDESMDTEQMKQPVQQDEFRAKPAWQRFMVMIAGVVMNVILAIVLYCGISYYWGESYFDNEDAKWGYMFNESGHALGFEDGDRFISIDKENVGDINGIINSLLLTADGREVVVERRGEPVTLNLTFEQLLEMRQKEGYKNLFTLRMPVLVDSVTYPSAIAAGLTHGDEIVKVGESEVKDFISFTNDLAQMRDTTALFTVKRGEDFVQLTMPIDSDGKVGFVALNPYSMRTRNYTFWESIPAGFRRTGKMISSYWEQIKLIVQPKSKMYEELGGFIAIGSIFPSEWNWQDFWLKTAFLSIILAIMNILPIPGLDGGHALFTLWEMVTGRRPSDKFLEVMQWIGLLLLFALLIYANGNDIYRFFIK